MKKLIINLALSIFASIITAPSFSEPQNLVLLKKEIIKYHDSGLYEKEITQAIADAQQFIMQQVALNKKRSTPQKLALVLDIDETSLSNYPHMAEHNFAASHEQIRKGIMAADAPAIQPTLALYKTALNQGITVFFVTGRSEDQREATKKNLLKAGYAQWAKLYLRPKEYADKSIIPFKAHTRELITKKGYTVVATIGDQYSDIKGGYAEKGFKLPNPYYYLP